MINSQQLIAQIESLVVDLVSDSKIGASPSRKHERRSADLARCRLRTETSDLVNNGKKYVELESDAAIDDEWFLPFCDFEERRAPGGDDVCKGKALDPSRLLTSARPSKLLTSDGETEADVAGLKEGARFATDDLSADIVGRLEPAESSSSSRTVPSILATVTLLFPSTFSAGPSLVSVLVFCSGIWTRPRPST